MCTPWKPFLPLLLLLTAGLLTAGLLTAGLAGQKATEVHIPIGRSPGVSGKVSHIGTCNAVDPEERVVTVRAGDQAWAGKVTEETQVFLDRSGLGLPNTYGTFDDLRVDRLMEIKYRDGPAASGGACEWIKVRMTAPGGKE